MMRFVSILILVMITQQEPSNKVALGSNEREHEILAKKNIAGFLPAIEQLEIEYSHDAEILMGIGILYSRIMNYSGDFDPNKLFDVGKWERVLSIDPNNRAVRAYLARRCCTYVSARKNQMLSRFDGKVELAKKRGATEIPIARGRHPGGTLYPYFEGDGEGMIMVGNFSESRAELERKLDLELKETYDRGMDMLDKGKKADPNNALYNYISAHLYFETGQSELAVEELRAAARKPYLNTYFTEQRKAVTHVLELIKFPDELRCYITDVYYPIGDFIRSQIWKLRLEPLAKEYEITGAIDKTREVYALTEQIGVHIRNEPVPYESGSNVGYGQSIEQWATEHLAEISNSEAPTVQSDGAERKGLRTVYMVAICAVSLGILGLVAVIIIKKKKR